MNETLSLETGLKQQLRLTPLQVQFVKMLEMSTPELEETVRRAVDEMPALEATYPDEMTQNDHSSPSISTDDDPTPLYNRRAYNYSANDNYYDIAAAAPRARRNVTRIAWRPISAHRYDRYRAYHCSQHHWKP